MTDAEMNIIEVMNNMVFEEEQEQAIECPHRKHMSHYVCDGCNIANACSSLPDKCYE